MMISSQALRIFVLCISTLVARAADPKYPVNNIPENLRKNVKAVVREDNMTFRIISPGKAKLYVYYAATIFNEKGKKFAEFDIAYDKLRKINKLSANVYDANGDHIKKLKNSEIIDQSLYDGSTLFSDDRMKSLDLTQGFYPYTVEVEYEIDYNYLFHIDGSSVIPDEDVAVEHFSYQLIYPPTLAPRYKTINISEEPIRNKTEDGLESLSWSFQNIQPIKFEPYARREKFIPEIIAAPSIFEFSGYPGNMSSWDEYGKWVASLNKGRNKLPQATVEKILSLTATARTTEEKTRILYEYLQNKTRYVGIQLGIGGYQPFEASIVDQTGYGDCKALSNYMMAMLETVGVKAHYALILAGRSRAPIHEDFPHSQFNHVIVAVPNERDTLWLECTSQTNPFGYQGSNTGDRKALLITEGGAKMVNTTRYPTEVNVQSRNATVKIDPQGNALANVKTTYTGLEYENDGLHFLVNYQYDDQKKWLQSTTEIPSFDLNAFSISQTKSKVPEAKIALELTLKRYATVSGKRIFVTPNLMNRNTFIPEKIEKRVTPVTVRAGFIHVDSIHYTLPEGIYPEFLPEPIQVQSRFGNYEASFKVDQGSLLYIRKLKIQKGEFAPDTYNELIDFYKNVSKADNTKVVFMSKT